MTTFTIICVILTASTAILAYKNRKLRRECFRIKHLLMERDGILKVTLEKTSYVCNEDIFSRQHCPVMCCNVANKLLEIPDEVKKVTLTAYPSYKNGRVLIDLSSNYGVMRVEGKNTTLFNEAKKMLREAMNKCRQNYVYVEATWEDKA